MSDAPDADQVGRSSWVRDERPTRRSGSRKERLAPGVTVDIALAGGTPTSPAPPQTGDPEPDRQRDTGSNGVRDEDEASGAKSQPAPVVATRPTLDLHHFYNPNTKDHLYVTNYDSGADRDGYEWRGTEGRIFGNAAPKTVALNGEEGRIGYVYRSHEPNTTALYYCVSGEGDLFTIREDVAAQAQYQAWRCQGIVGYVGA
jgi:hypothetical protein